MAVYKIGVMLLNLVPAWHSTLLQFSDDWWNVFVLCRATGSVF